VWMGDIRLDKIEELRNELFLTTVCYFKKVAQRAWHHSKVRLARTMPVFNLVVSWDGFHRHPTDFFHLSIASFC
jgi:hypothetical protein